MSGRPPGISCPTSRAPGWISRRVAGSTPPRGERGLRRHAPVAAPRCAHIGPSSASSRSLKAKAEPKKERTPRLDDAGLPHRTLALAGLACARCGGRRGVLALKGTKHHVVTDKRGSPLAVLLSTANVHDKKCALPLLDAIQPIHNGRGGAHAGLASQPQAVAHPRGAPGRHSPGPRSPGLQPHPAAESCRALSKGVLNAEPTAVPRAARPLEGRAGVAAPRGARTG
jgi:hypothetical protein